VGRIDYDTHDVQLQMLIDAAEEFAEEHCSLSLTSKTITDERADGGMHQLWPKVLPLTAVSSVADAWNDDDVVAASDYLFTETRIVVEEGGQFLEGELRYKISYTAGYTSVTAPVGLKAAIIGLVLLSYNNSEGKSSQAAKGFGTDFKSLGDNNDVIARLDHFSLRRYFE
ncbi:MAG: phage gp6-like head-tail connector protein, partial [Deltaproteobacteria bacterium]|nr:phage gp6-like head-tail connector protein [Deltaproteobacteria bacterium]